MKWVIDVVSKTSDYVILDSAPVGLLTDASVLAQFADCSMFIAKKDFARVEHIMNGIEHLSESNIPVIGCVINGD
jgi:Mrp family chromosome partitioning ATPase